MAFCKAYIGAYLAAMFPRVTNLYEKVSGKKIPYRGNKVIGCDLNEIRENHLVGARFKQGILEKTAANTP